MRARACVLACMCEGTRKHTRKRRPLHPFGMAHTRSLFALLSHACHARSHARAHAHKQARTHTHARTHARTHAHKCVLTQGRDRPHGRRRRRVHDFREADQHHRAGGQREQVSAAQCMEGHVRAGSQRVCVHVRLPCSSSVSRGGEAARGAPHDLPHALRRSLDAGATFVQANGKSILAFTTSAIAGQVRPRSPPVTPSLARGRAYRSASSVGRTN